MHVSQPDAARIVIRLEKKQIVTCYFCDIDKRIKRFKITELGLNFCHEAQVHMENTENKMHTGMTDEEKRLFNRLLNQALNNLCEEV